MAFEDTVRSVLDHKGVGVCSVSPDTPVLEALGVMSKQDIGAVLVVEDGALRGVMSERDYARKVILEGKSSKDTCVGEIMDSSAVTASLGDSIGDCMRTMTDERVRYLPVIEQGALIGVVSIGDLVNWVIRRQEEEIHHLQGYIAGSYPA